MCIYTYRDNNLDLVKSCTGVKKNKSPSFHGVMLFLSQSHSKHKTETCSQYYFCTQAAYSHTRTKIFSQSAKMPCQLERKLFTNFQYQTKKTPCNSDNYRHCHLNVILYLAGFDLSKHIAEQISKKIRNCLASSLSLTCVIQSSIQ